MVMTSGIQMSSPVMKYFFTVAQMKRPGLRRAGSCSPLGQSLTAGVAVFLVSDLDSVFASVLDSVFESAFAPTFASAFKSVFLSAGFLAVVLKSVAYQPLPFS